MTHWRFRPVTRPTSLKIAVQLPRLVALVDRAATHPESPRQLRLRYTLFQIVHKCIPLSHPCICGPLRFCWSCQQRGPGPSHRQSMCVVWVAINGKLTAVRNSGNRRAVSKREFADAETGAHRCFQQRFCFYCRACDPSRHRRFRCPKPCNFRCPLTPRRTALSDAGCLWQRGLSVQCRPGVRYGCGIATTKSDCPCAPLLKSRRPVCIISTVRRVYRE